MAISDELRYEQASEALRHYSLSVFNIRSLAIAQGLVVLSGSLYLIKEGFAGFSLCASLFGLLFTWVLYALQKNYWHQFDDLLQYAMSLEADFKEHSRDLGPWSSYGITRNQRFMRRAYRLRVKYGPYVLLASALSIVILYDLVIIISKKITVP